MRKRDRQHERVVSLLYDVALGLEEVGHILDRALDVQERSLTLLERYEGGTFEVLDELEEENENGE